MERRERALLTKNRKEHKRLIYVEMVIGVGRVDVMVTRVGSGVGDDGGSVRSTMMEGSYLWVLVLDWRLGVISELWTSRRSGKWYDTGVRSWCYKKL